MLKARASVVVCGLEHLRIAQRWWDVDPPRRGPSKYSDKGFKQGGDVIGDCALRPRLVKRLFYGRVQPALQDRVALTVQHACDPAQIRATGQLFHAAVDVGLNTHSS